ncbi:MAG: hypothetical protein GXP32_03280, partial [Kiritimatiellaeota bacterium]|nr:hypothetical protein [Kiritimatiellota bacterium]
ESGLVKRNSERDVFAVSAGGVDLYVKHAHPATLLQKTRSILAPKLKSEFNAIKLLESKGVPVVRCPGWGRKGAESILITETAPTAINAKRFWFSRAAGDPEIKKEFLTALEQLLSKFIAAETEHPDLHPGNIIASTQSGETRPILMFVDLYGVHKSSRSLESRFSNTLSLIAAFRGELTDAEAVEFIENVAKNLEKPPQMDAAARWMLILERETEKAAALWRKRQPKILSDPRYSRMIELGDGRVCRVRTTLAGERSLNVERVKRILTNSDEELAVERITGSEAARRWFHSSLLELHRLPRQRVLGWIENDSGDDEILVEKTVQTILSGPEIEKRHKMAFHD